jgi:hypothetical protein
VIEQIKERLSNLDAGKVVKYDHAMNLATQYMVDYRNDVSYLLSIIEQYEHRMKVTTVELQDWVRKFEVLVLDKEYMDATKKIIADNYEFHLKSIQVDE